MYLYDAPDHRACDLECAKAKDSKRIGEYTGPVRIVLLHSPLKEIWARICCAGFIGLTYILLGATFFVVFFFTLAMKLPFGENIHVLLCTVGFQLLIPLGILMFSSINGPSVPLTKVFKKLNHALVQICGLACGIAGGMFIVIDGKQEDFFSIVTVHSVIGFLACILGLIGASVGPYLLFSKIACNKEFFHPFHKAFGTIFFLTSSLCFITGLTKPSIVKWLPLPQMLYYLIAFCVIYTVIIFSVPFIKYLTNRDEVQ